MRPIELAESAAHHRLRRGRDARLPRLRHGRHAAERAPRLVPPGRPRRGHRPARRRDPAHPAAGHPHLRRRPARLPAPRPPAGPRHLRAGVRPGRRPRLVPRARRAVPAVEAVLLDVVAGPHARRPRALLARDGKSPFDEKWFERPDQDDRITTRHRRRRLPVRPLRRRCGPTPPRSTRPRAGGSASPTTSSTRSTRGRTGSSPARSSARSPTGRPRTTCSPACATASRSERDADDARVQYRVVVGKKDERVEGPDDADLVVTAPLDVVQAADFDADRRVHAGQAEVGRADRRAVRPAALGRGGGAAQRARSASLSSL